MLYCDLMLIFHSFNDLALPHEFRQQIGQEHAIKTENLIAREVQTDNTGA